MPSKWLARFGSLALLAAIGWADASTGWEASLYVFYAIPILLSVWYGGRGDGLIFATLATVMWWVANRYENPYATAWGYHWASLSRFAYFAFMAIGGAALKTQRDNDRARIAALERTRELEKEILEISEQEQQRIGRDLHDGLCQHLLAVSLSARLLSDRLAEDGDTRSVDARQIEQSLKDAAAQARDLARGLFPIQLEGGGLGVALDEMAANTQRLTGMKVVFSEVGDTGIADPTVGMQLYRIAQEALGNAIKHGLASLVEISMEQRGTALTLKIVDNGKGFSIEEKSDPGEAAEGSRGMGLKSMRYRARSISADLCIGAGQQGGVMVVCTLVNRPPHVAANNG